MLKYRLENELNHLILNSWHRDSLFGLINPENLIFLHAEGDHLQAKNNVHVPMDTQSTTCAISHSYSLLELRKQIYHKRRTPYAQTVKPRRVKARTYDPRMQRLVGLQWEVRAVRCPSS